MPESTLTLTIHGLTLGGIVLIVGLSLKQHRVWIRLKDRVNQLWYDRCHEKGDKYEPLENGNR